MDRLCWRIEANAAPRMTSSKFKALADSLVRWAEPALEDATHKSEAQFKTTSDEPLSAVHFLRECQSVFPGQHLPSAENRFQA